MRTIRTKVYKFNELSKKAQKVAIDNCYDININLDFAIEDAQNIGLSITDHGIDSASFVYNVKGEFITSAGEVVESILREHGQECETYKTALKFKNKFQLASNETDESELSATEDEFLSALLNDYKNIMQRDIEYQSSREQIIQTIEGNDYEFTKDGNQFTKN